MHSFPQEPKKIRERIRRYERGLRQEAERFGGIDDSAGKRYWLGPLYLLMGDFAGAMRAFEWFKQTFPNDSGEPFHSLCWTLALYRSGNIPKATQKLRHTMLSNLYLIPHLLHQDQSELDIWHGSNVAMKDYLHYLPPEFEALWDRPALQWAKETYESAGFRRVRSRYIEIYRQLKQERPGPRRSQLVKEAFELQNSE
ncbi:MAG: hypothetical protein HY782_05265 [Chloroflexi bacterium]|nr:hypothetical protein [Chloroflexota bacterium]